MGYEAERQAIESRFTTQWASATNIAYDNVDYTPTPDQAFVTLRILPDGSVQASLGDSPLFRHPGIIIVGVFVSQGQGTKIARDFADTAMAIFRSAPVFSGILCRAPYMEVIGEKEGWYQIDVIVPFQRDESY